MKTKLLILILSAITINSWGQTLQYRSSIHEEKYSIDSIITVVEQCMWTFKLNYNVLKYESEKNTYIEKITDYSFDQTILIWTYDSNFEIVYKDDYPYVIYEFPIRGDILYKMYWLDGEF